MTTRHLDPVTGIETLEETATRTPDLLDLLTLAGRSVEAPDGLVLGWRNTHPDLVSRNDFQWSFPGQWTESLDDGRDLTTNHPMEACPSEVLGGLCVAKTWLGARSGGITSAACLVLAYKPEDVLYSADLRSANRAFAPRGDRYTQLPADWKVDESGLVVPS